MIRPFLALFPPALLSAALLAASPAAAAPTTAPARTRAALVFGDDPCPKSQGDEIVVCAREPEGERYRLPKRFRGKRDEPAAVSGSWANTARAADQASTMMLPNSCSAIGSYGQSGCTMQFLQQYSAERRAAKAAAAEATEPDGN